MLINKVFLNQDDLNKLVFSKKVTKTFVDQESFLHRALSGVITNCAGKSNWFRPDPASWVTKFCWPKTRSAGVFIFGIVFQIKILLLNLSVTASFCPSDETETGWFSFVFPPELLNPYPDNIISADSFRPNPVFELLVGTEYEELYS